MNADQIIGLIGLVCIALVVVVLAFAVIADAKAERELDRFYRERLYLPPKEGTT